MSKTTKRNYAYFVVPILGLAIFGAVYWNFSKTYDLKQQAIHRADLLKKQQAIEQQNAERLKAVKKAEADSAKAQAKKDLEAQQQAQRNDKRSEDLQARDKAESDSITYRDQVDKLKRDVGAIEDEIKAVEKDERLLRAQKDAVEDVSLKAQDNVRELAKVLQKIQDADNAAAAAAAAKTKSS